MHRRTQIAHARRLLKDIQGKLPDRYAKRGDFVSALKQQGFRVVGRGGFAVVMAHSAYPDIVVKVGQVISNKKWLQGRNAFCSFMAYCDWLRNTGTRSRYALRVYHHEWVSEARGGTYVAIVERCKPGRNARSIQAVTAAAYVGGSARLRDTTHVDVAALRFLSKLNDACLGTLDVHAANVMMRADGTAVITDPLC